MKLINLLILIVNPALPKEENTLAEATKMVTLVFALGAIILGICLMLSFITLKGKNAFFLEFLTILEKYFEEEDWVLNFNWKEVKPKLIN